MEEESAETTESRAVTGAVEEESAAEESLAVTGVVEEESLVATECLPVATVEYMGAVGAVFGEKRVFLAVLVGQTHALETIWGIRTTRIAENARIPKTFDEKRN